MIRSYAFALLAAGCTELVTVDVGPGHLAPLEVHGDLWLGALPPGSCPEITRPFDGVAGSASFAPVATACMVTLRFDDIVLLPGATLESFGDLDTTAIVGIDVEAMALDLHDEHDAPLGRAVREAVLEVAGAAIVHTRSLEPFEAERIALAPELVDALVEAFEAHEDLRADVEMRLTFAEPDAVPLRLRLRLVVQPIVRLDAVRAVF